MEKSISIKKLICDNSKYNKTEIEFWKNIFLSKKPIPSPHINNNNEVTAFHNSFFALKELDIPEIIVVY